MHRYAKSLEQAESAAIKLGLKNYELSMSGKEAIIIIDKATALEVCKKNKTTGHEIGKEGKFALTNLGKFI